MKAYGNQWLLRKEEPVFHRNEYSGRLCNPSAVPKHRYIRAMAKGVGRMCECG